MTQITENNKLIAEFIGLTEQKDSSKRFLGQWFDNEGIINGQRNVYLLFHNSWNWLMPVIDKLENQGVEITIGRMFCEIKYQDVFNKDKHFDIRIVSGVKINAVNGAIVELIKWYNQNK